MSASRGDSKPCTQPRCDGTMQFGRSSDNHNDRREPARAGRVRVATSADNPDPMGWICSIDAEHFRTGDSVVLTLVSRER